VLLLSPIPDAFEVNLSGQCLDAVAEPARHRKGAHERYDFHGRKRSLICVRPSIVGSRMRPQRLRLPCGVTS
jgi:hypothetical protein